MLICWPCSIIFYNNTNNFGNTERIDLKFHRIPLEKTAQLLSKYKVSELCILNGTALKPVVRDIEDILSYQIWKLAAFKA